jgi:hypothetical protein
MGAWHGIGYFNYSIQTPNQNVVIKTLNCQGNLWQVFIRVYRLEIQSVMLLFSTQLLNSCPCNLLSGSTLPPPPPPRVNNYTL